MDARQAFDQREAQAFACALNTQSPATCTLWAGYALVEGWLEGWRVALDHGADVRDRAPMGGLPWWVMPIAYPTPTSTAMLAEVLAHAPDALDAPLRWQGQVVGPALGQTAWFACSDGPDWIRLLLQQGARWQAPMPQGQSVWAHWLTHTQAQLAEQVAAGAWPVASAAFQALSQAPGAFTDPVDGHPSALAWAWQHQAIALAHALLEAGAPIDTPVRPGITVGQAWAAELRRTPTKPGLAQRLSERLEGLLWQAQWAQQWAEQPLAPAPRDRL